MNNKRYFVSQHDIRFLNDIYDYIKTTGLGKCSDVDRKFSNLIAKLSKIESIQRQDRLK